MMNCSHEAIEQITESEQFCGKYVKTWKYVRTAESRHHIVG